MFPVIEHELSAQLKIECATMQHNKKVKIFATSLSSNPPFHLFFVFFSTVQMLFYI